MEEMLYTVKEVAKILKTNDTYVYKLKNSGLLRFMKIGSLKCRKSTLEAFLAKYDGKDISDPFNVKEEVEAKACEKEGNITKLESNTPVTAPVADSMRICI